MIMSNEGQCLLSYIYQGVVFLALIHGPDTRSAFTGPMVL